MSYELTISSDNDASSGVYATRGEAMDAADEAERKMIDATNPDRRYNAYTAAYLAKFAKVTADKGVPMVVHGNRGSRPTVVTIGENFFGLIMPVKHDQGDYVKPVWLV